VRLSARLISASVERRSRRGTMAYIGGAGTGSDYGGAPKGNKNALRHGLYTAQSIAARRAIRAVLCDSRELLEHF
jgi:uncharacterized protein YjcR